ncbi:MAG: tRNA-dihydrouridine synthase family protein [bacterium]
MNFFQKTRDIFSDTFGHLFSADVERGDLWYRLKQAKAGLEAGKAGEKPAEPIFVLAPMADVTDAAFRKIIAKYSRMGARAQGAPDERVAGGPDAMWTEFVSADGLARAPKIGRDKLLRDLLYSEGERPIIAQFFTSNPAHMELAAELAVEMGFDGIDINMGCPDKSIEKQGAGASMIKSPRVARRVLRAALRGAANGAKKYGKPVPAVSVKTRIGYGKNELATWLPALLAERPALITVHARNRKELSLVPARWEHVREAVEIRDRVQANLPIEKRTLIFGNGDARNLADAREKARMSGADGVMLGRAIFGNPWLFDESAYMHVDTNAGGKGVDAASGHAIGFGGAVLGVDHFYNKAQIEERLRVMVEHTELFEKLLGDLKNFSIMKKHYKAYVHGWEGAKELRALLMQTNSAGEAKGVVDNYLTKTS